jgi:hypothetical protein
MAIRPTPGQLDMGQAIADVENGFPGWHCWEGIGGDLYYARRLRSGPPIVLRAETLDDLREKVQKYLVTGQRS